MSSRVEYWDAIGGQIKRRGRTSINPGRSALQPGVDKPNATNTGVLPGIARTTYTGSMTITTADTVLQNLNINGALLIRAPRVTIRNCYITGLQSTATTATACIVADHSANVGLYIEDCSLVPAFPSLYTDGIYGHDYTCMRVYVANTVDYFGGFNSGNAAAPLNILIQQCFGEKFSFFSPDPTHSDNQTHCDGFQIQGGSGPVKLWGNCFRAYYSTDSGVGNTPTPDRGSGATDNSDGRYNWYDIAAVTFSDYPKGTFSVDTGSSGHIDVWDNWLEGGRRGINAGSANTNVGRWWRNKFTHDQGEQGSGGDNTFTICMDPTTTCDTGDGTSDQNVYEDTGNPVTVRRNQ